MKIQTQIKKQERLIAKHQREDPSVVAAAASGSEAVPAHEGVNMLKQNFPMFSVKARLDSFPQSVYVSSGKQRLNSRYPKVELFKGHCDRRSSSSCNASVSIWVEQSIWTESEKEQRSNIRLILHAQLR